MLLQFELFWFCGDFLELQRFYDIKLYIMSLLLHIDCPRVMYITGFPENGNETLRHGVDTMGTSSESAGV